MNAYKKLVSNSFTFALGNLGSKIISLVLVPIYTYYLSTAEFGTVDITTSTVTMLVPIVSASIFDALLRFTMEEDSEGDVILTNSILVNLIGLTIAFLFYPILYMNNVLPDYLLYIYVILVVQLFEKTFNQYARAIGKIKVFALNGVLLTFTTGMYNIIFLVFLNAGVNGYFMATILSYSTSILYLIYSTKMWKSTKLTNFNKEITKSMLKFSLPLVPNSIAWWLINTSSRYFILYFVGVSANGLFAVASRIPALVNLINQIFTQAWQLSAIEEYKNENKSDFYSNVFMYLAMFLFIGTSAVTAIIKPVFLYLFAAEYFDGWKVVPYLLLGTVFSSFAGFIGTNYIAAKQSKGVLRTSVYSGIISTVLNLLLIPFLGFVGAGISSMVSFFALFVIRYHDTKKFIEMKINWKSQTLNILIIIIQIFVLNLGLNSLSELLFEIALFVALTFVNLKTIKLLVNFIGNKV